jgi:hypothetical protein
VRVRLVRIARRPVVVSADIRAALTSLGRGNTVVGGIALIGAQPDGCDELVDVVVVRPGGVVIVVGVELPGPAVLLDAPLESRWKADGWPLVRTDDAVNPATDVLALAAVVRDRVLAVDGVVTPIGTVVAVGPYVESVEQPAADLAGNVRVLHPTPTSMLAAIVSLTSATTPLSVPVVQRLLHTLAPDAPQQPADLLIAEGFPAEPEPERLPAPVDRTPAPPASGPPADLPAAVSTASPGPLAAPQPPPPAPGTTRKSGVARWLPLGALGLLLVLVVVAVALATSAGDDEAVGGSGTPTAPAVHMINGLPLRTVATAPASRCAPHATGDLQRTMRSTQCLALRRGSFEATMHGRRIAVSVAGLTFTDRERAEKVKQLSDTPGSGAIADLASETGKWTPPEPGFAGAAYASDTGEGTDGDAGTTTVRIVQAGWADGASDPADPALVRAGEAGLAVPLSQ